MFEIPDDDDNFWEDLPLNDISNENVTPVKVQESDVQKNQQYSFNQNHFNKKRCTTINDDPLNHQGRQFPNNNVTPGQTNVALERGQDGGCNESKDNLEGKLIDSLRGPCLNIPPQPSRVLVPFTQEVVLSRDPLVNSPRTPSGGTSDSDIRNGHSISSSKNGRVSNKRKRKFPGPAGLLPKLGQSHTLDSPDVSKVKEDNVSPEQVIEKTDLILSSQSGEEVFNDRPWQTLMKDLQDDGQDTLQRFSLASSLQKAKKKQLPRGKILFVMAVIETLEWPGKDASVTLKDKSGTIQGTIHESLMKEYECDLQPGSVLVLRQVSVISPTSRNHYLNITPANVVCVYCNKTEGLSRLHFVDKDKPLPSILKDLEREMMAELTPQRSGLNTPQLRLNMGTPDIRNLQSRFNVGTPNLGTPQARYNLTTPNIRTPQPRFNTSTPNMRTPQVRLNMGTPNIGTPQGRSNMGPSDITAPQSRFNTGTSNIRTPQARLNMGTPDVRNPQPRFCVGNVGNTNLQSSTGRDRAPGVGLSGVQGATVSRTGPSHSIPSPGNIVANDEMRAGASKAQMNLSIPGSSTTQTGPNFSIPNLSTPEPQQRSLQSNSSIVPQIHVPKSGNASYNSGSATFSTPKSGMTSRNNFPNSVNRTPQGVITPGCGVESSSSAAPGVHNPYRLQPQISGQPTGKSKSPSDFQKSESAMDSSVIGPCRVSSSDGCPGVSSINFPHSVNNGSNCDRLNKDSVASLPRNLNNSASSAVNTPNRKGFKFKSTKLVTSSNNSVSLQKLDNSASLPGKGSASSVPDSSRQSNVGVDSLWQDDLSDDLLSQLSEELV